MIREKSSVALALVLTAFVFDGVNADDWPQWLGKNRDSRWCEEGIVDRFPQKGLRVKWSETVGMGYSGPIVAEGKVVVTDYVRSSGEITNAPSQRDRLEGVERVLCFDSLTGKLIWKHVDQRQYEISYPGGPRCTPTIDGDKVYTLGAEGHLLCLEMESGETVWEKDLKNEYKTESPIWGFAAHPLVDGNSVYCVVGGEGSVAVALNKHTGDEIWRALSAADPGYCPPTIIQHAGVRQLLIWHTTALNGLDPNTGKIYWSVPLQPSYGMSIAAPRKSGNLLFASGIGHVGAMLKLNDDEPDAEILWHGTANSAVYSSNTTPILQEPMIYGVDCSSGAMVAARLEDGKREWETFQPTTGGRRASHGTAFLVQHADRFFLFSETGHLILAKMSPAGYEELDRFHVLEPTNSIFGRNVVWSHPAFAEKCMFARNDELLTCVDLSADQ